MKHWRPNAGLLDSVSSSFNNHTDEGTGAQTLVCLTRSLLVSIITLMKALEPKRWSA
ncbi:UNVERIFIED_CONTAM: hypothetical protein FKN15_028566 [Acipenser sinensis]